MDLLLLGHIGNKVDTGETIFLLEATVETQYGHSQSEKKLGLGEKYHRSIKVHTLEAQNQHQLKSPLSDLFYDVNFQK